MCTGMALRDNSGLTWLGMVGLSSETKMAKERKTAEKWNDPMPQRIGKKHSNRGKKDENSNNDAMIISNPLDLTSSPEALKNKMKLSWSLHFL